METYYLYKLLLANGVLLAIACYAIVRFERRCKEIEAFWASPTGLALADTSDADTSDADTSDADTSDKESQNQLRQTQRLEQRVGELQRAVGVLALREKQAGETTEQPVERNLPLENAVRMARNGASIEDLTRSCGLNIGEAQLMQKLHRQAQSAAAAN